MPCHYSRVTASELPAPTQENNNNSRNGLVQTPAPASQPAARDHWIQTQPLSLALALALALAGCNIRIDYYVDNDVNQNCCKNTTTRRKNIMRVQFVVVRRMWQCCDTLLLSKLSHLRLLWLCLFTYVQEILSSWELYDLENGVSRYLGILGWKIRKL